jgi:hypothetical protein
MSEGYYGDDSNQVISFLEFGSINVRNQKKNIWGFLFHQDAYDSYMFSRYAKDMFYYREFANGENPITSFWETSQKTAHRDLQANILKYAGYRAVNDNIELQKRATICEIGSSLFGLIDEIAALDRLMNDGICIEAINTAKYIGCEISEFMNKGAKELHSRASFDFYTDPMTSQFLEHNVEYDLFYGYSISMHYALRKTQDMIGLINRGKLNIFRRLCFSIGETKSVDLGTGKKGYFISMKEFLELLKETGMSARFYNYAATVNQTTLTIAIDVVVGEPDYIDRFTNYYKSIHQEFSSQTPFQLGKGTEWSDLLLLDKYIGDKELSYLANKKVTIFGTGKAAIHTLNKLNQHHIEVAYCIDNDKYKWDVLFAGHQINNPNFLLQENQDSIYVVIASMYYGEISAQLRTLGLREFEHFINYDFLFFS